MQKPDERPQVVSTIWPPWLARTKQNARWPSPTVQARGHSSHRIFPFSAGDQKRAGWRSDGSSPSMLVSLELIEVEVTTDVAVRQRFLHRRSASDHPLEVLVRDQEAGAPASELRAGLGEPAAEEAEIRVAQALAVGAHARQEPR